MNTLTSEFVIIDNPFPNQDPVCGIHLMNQFFFVYGKLGWYRFDLRGNLLDMHTNPEDSNKWPILCESDRIVSLLFRGKFKKLWKNVFSSSCGTHEFG